MSAEELSPEIVLTKIAITTIVRVVTARHTIAVGIFKGDASRALRALIIPTVLERAVATSADEVTCLARFALGISDALISDIAFTAERCK